MTKKDIAKKYNLPEEEFLIRMDGRIEWVCEHGVGHTVYNPHDWGKYTFVHGCDGCCNKLENNG